MYYGDLEEFPLLLSCRTPRMASTHNAIMVPQLLQVSDLLLLAEYALEKLK
jgi:hypothetical protein